MSAQRGDARAVQQRTSSPMVAIKLLSRYCVALDMLVDDEEHHSTLSP